ncbi:acetylglutamate kinase [Salirhabdus salicampi]|uniref:acetylglutamate kinase n=1 Tax=Salirhabdus salicampi TaxID=476102 RepID=UPI0020C2493F|nr:acetylglutamate kinase [Salirhabdus salicampi]MCP8617319.1 acetylglutamate kinase [Salirhabdus salicampi]
MNYLVVKFGGSVLEELPDTFYENIVQLQKEGKWQPIIVHGGGPAISKKLEQLSLELQFVDGLRVTTKEVLDVVEMVLSGTVNKGIVRSIAKAGGKALGFSGVDGEFLQVKQVPNKALGYVGEVTNVNETIISDMALLGYIPVISPIGIDGDGQTYNVNGDVAAAAIAKSLKAKLCFVSDVPGVYHIQHGEKKILNKVSSEEIESMIAAGVIKDGMIPKAQAAIDGLNHNVKEVAILNGKERDSLIHYSEGKRIGTRVVLGGEVANG